MQTTCHTHEWMPDGEVVRTGGDGRVERYRQRFACVHCGASSRGPWKLRSIAAQPGPRRTAAELAELRASLYGPE